MLSHEVRNAALAIALCLIAFFLIKVTMKAGVLNDFEGARKLLSSTASYTIEISGSGGVPFQGTYGMTQSDGTSSSRSVEDSVPATFHGEGALASCFFQKHQAGGTMRVTLRRNGQIVAEEETDAAYGVVTIAK